MIKANFGRNLVKISDPIRQFYDGLEYMSSQTKIARDKKKKIVKLLYVLQGVGYLKYAANFTATT